MVVARLRPDRAGDPSSDAFIAWWWQGADGERLVVAVNYSADRGRCFVRLPVLEEPGRTVRLRDLLSDAVYDRDAGDLTERGLYLDIPGWAYHVFTVTARP